MPAVSFTPDWFTNANDTGLYVAAARGYFVDAGLDVQFLPPPRAHRVAAAVAGRTDFGICYQEQITIIRAASQPVSVVSTAAIMQHNTTWGFSRLHLPASIVRAVSWASDTPDCDTTGDNT